MQFRSTISTYGDLVYPKEKTGMKHARIIQTTK